MNNLNKSPRPNEPLVTPPPPPQLPKQADYSQGERRTKRGEREVYHSACVQQGPVCVQQWGGRGTTNGGRSYQRRPQSVGVFKAVYSIFVPMHLLDIVQSVDQMYLHRKKRLSGMSLTVFYSVQS